MPHSIITLMTDFGQTDHYVAQMKAAILAVNTDVQFIDVTHEIPPQNVLKAAVTLHDIAQVFPAGTIHLCVVDPGVGSQRRIVAVECAGQRFIGPDNGVLGLLPTIAAPTRVVEVTAQQFWRASVSATFHGRDIMAPVAGHWSNGIDVAEFGVESVQPLAVVTVPQPQQTATSITGVILWADRFGNLVTNIQAAHLPPGSRDAMLVQVGAQEIRGIHGFYGEQPVGSVLALFGSTGRLELAVNGGSAASTLQMKAGGTVTVTVEG